MELNVVKSEFKRRKTVFSGNCEIGLESEIVLPDSCPDIEKILKCTLNPRILSKRLDATRLFISGTAFLRILYLDNSGCVRSFDTQTAFSKNLDVNAEGENPLVCVKPTVQYLNCRVLSPRRFDMHSALYMNISIKACDTVSFVTDIQNEGVELKRKKIEALIPVYAACENFTVMEEYELSSPIAAVTKMNADAKILEYKCVSGRVLLRGEAELDICYLSENSEAVQNSRYILPVSHILSCPDAQEGDNIYLTLDICRVSCEPISKSEDKEIAVEVLLEACCEVNRKQEIDTVVDAYCIGRECAISRNQTELGFFEAEQEKNHRFLIKTEAEDVEEVIDTYAETKNVQFSLNEQGELMAKCDIDASLVYKNGEGEVHISQKTAPLELSVAADKEFVGADYSGDIRVLSCDRGQSKNEINVNLFAAARLNKSENIDSLCQMEVSEYAANDTDAKTALTIYFAEKGEDAFDIAKRYNTSAKAVMDENGLDDTLLKESRRILIPILR